MPSTNIELKTNPEFKALLRDLSPEEFAQLEQNIIDAKGATESILVWSPEGSDDQFIVDGHNRYAICTKHGLSFRTRKIPGLKTADDVTEFMIRHQLGRRNLTQEEMIYFRGKLYTNLKGKRGGDQTEARIDAAKQVADETGVTPRTVKRNANFAEAVDKIGAVDPELKKKALEGEAGSPAAVERVAKDITPETKSVDLAKAMTSAAEAVSKAKGKKGTTAKSKGSSATSNAKNQPGRVVLSEGSLQYEIFANSGTMMEVLRKIVELADSDDDLGKHDKLSPLLAKARRTLKMIDSATKDESAKKAPAKKAEPKKAATAKAPAKKAAAKKASKTEQAAAAAEAAS